MSSAMFMLVALIGGLVLGISPGRTNQAGQACRPPNVTKHVLPAIGLSIGISLLGALAMIGTSTIGVVTTT